MSQFVLFIITSQTLSSITSLLIRNWVYLGPRILAVIFVFIILHITFLCSPKSYIYIWVSPFSLYFTVLAYFKMKWYDVWMFGDTKTMYDRDEVHAYFKRVFILVGYISIIIYRNVDIFIEVYNFEISRLKKDYNGEELVNSILAFQKIQIITFILVISLSALIIYLLIKIYPEAEFDANYIYVVHDFIRFILLFCIVLVLTTYIPPLFISIYNLDIYFTALEFTWDSYIYIKEWFLRAV